jgi:hypothetical protein
LLSSRNRLGRELAPFLDESEKDLERHGRLATARMIEKNPWLRSAPAVKQGYEPALHTENLNRVDDVMESPMLAE